MKSIVVGGGLLGLSTGYYLAKDGHDVVVLEAGDQLGGLATDVEVEGVAVDRFYHCILNADDHLISLIDEVGLSDEVRMRPVRAGFYTEGKTHPISSPFDLLRFPPLGIADRLRLVRSLLACRRVKDWQTLETVDVETWLRERSGDRVFERVWKPLLSAKFDGNFGSTPATYIWSRTVRMSDTRSTGGRSELSGHLVGGYRVLCDRLAREIERLGGSVRVSSPVEHLVTRDGKITEVRTSGEALECDSLVLTTPLPITVSLLDQRVELGLTPPARTQEISSYVGDLEQMQDYLGVVCVLLMLRRRLSDNYTLYLADDDLPFTAVVETTNIIDPELVGGNHLVYLPKYAAPDSEVFSLPDSFIRTWFITKLQRVFPDLKDDDIIAAPVFRAPHVEPLHPLGTLGTVPATKTPLQGVWIGSTKHFYPRLNNADSVTRLAAELAEEIGSEMSQESGSMADASRSELQEVSAR